MAENGLPPGMLPLLIEKMVQLDDLKALENNTLEMWRAMARYEIQKESETRELQERTRKEFMALQMENCELRKELAVRASMNPQTSQSQSTYDAYCCSSCNVVCCCYQCEAERKGPRSLFSCWR
eukprot:Blabericola_migrator_1__3904@NODE_217_length_11276_cov_60_022660_g184_i0_p8_GENE_NODE_217_length_11276_cov_60_022660_g184_i0NODE_217_length_11276_cov_60_022660_g184_i0_p8_ORF_typecomplete_len124_score21_23APC_N_CC/PF16689_5/7_1e02APC_N_CC/PF16689_5/0_09HTH_Tnp_1/PF01527_20/0_12Cast/PF10174_9/0_12SCP1/PF05483_12/0_21_NODE_217_length_11276_cov_60_022660_g184_i0452823